MGAKKDKVKGPVVMGRVAQVNLCPEGFVLSIGPFSLWLGSSTALDVVETLARALALQVGDPERQPAVEGASPRTEPSRRPHRRNRLLEACAWTQPPRHPMRLAATAPGAGAGRRRARKAQRQ